MNALGWVVRSPLNIDQTLGEVFYSYTEIDQKIADAAQGQTQWSNVLFQQRKKVLLESVDALIRNKVEIQAESKMETGRPDADLELEWDQVIEWRRTVESYRFAEDLRPRGVVAIVGSSFWPIYHSIHFVTMALMMGNSVVVKPSEKTTLSVRALLKKWSEVLEQNEPHATGILQTQMGERELSRRLICHAGVQAVIFQGSTEAGVRVRQDVLASPEKEVLLFLGAKNSFILLAPDGSDHSSTEQQQATLIQDAFLSAGQHCTSASIAFIPDSCWTDWKNKIHQTAKSLSVDQYLGPLVDDSMLDRYIKFAGISEREGAEVLMRGKPWSDNKTGPRKSYLVTPTIVAFDQLSPDQFKKSISLQTEILSPHLSLIRYQTVDELIALFQQSYYGLSASIWSSQRKSNYKWIPKLDVGEVRFNESLLPIHPDRSYQSRKKSGNHAFHGFRLAEQLGTVRIS